MKNYTQAHIADKLGIGQRAYSKIENGDTKLTLDRLTELAKILETDVTKLIDFDEKYIYQNYNTHNGDGIVIQKEIPDMIEKIISKIESIYSERLREKITKLSFYAKWLLVLQAIKQVT